jgi:phage baseplate assembly protein V
MMDAIEWLWRRATRLVGHGRITAGKSTGPVHMYQIRVNDLDIRDNVPHLSEFGFISMPPLGTDVVMVCLEGNPRKSILVGTNHQPSLPQGLLPGESMVFNLWGMSIYMTQAGIVVQANSQPVTVNDATTVTINASAKVRMVTPLLEVTGDIIDNSATNAHTMGQMRTIYNSHTHSDPQGGAVSVPTTTM